MVTLVMVDQEQAIHTHMLFKCILLFLAFDSYLVTRVEFKVYYYFYGKTLDL